MQLATILVVPGRASEKENTSKISEFTETVTNIKYMKL